jgi:hypothetical protein
VIDAPSPRALTTRAADEFGAWGAVLDEAEARA